MILQQPLAFVDIETTGLDVNRAEIIEIGVVLTKLKDGELTIMGELNLKVTPTHIENADPVALRVNGYNEVDWMFAVSLPEAMKQFVKMTEGAVFVAHNVTFDYGFIEYNLKKCDLENKMHYHKLDTISIAFGILHNNDDISKLSLKALCEKYSIGNAHAHSAYSDAYATYEVFKKLLNLK